MKTLALLTLIALTSCQTYTKVCRHRVLGDYALLKEHHEHVEIVHVKNPPGHEWDYHAAVRIKQHGKWTYPFEPFGQLAEGSHVMRSYTIKGWIDYLDKDIWKQTGGK